MSEQTKDPLYSGLETSSMVALGCSLRIQPGTKYAAGPIKLDPCKVTVKFDGSPNKNVAFKGCTVLQLNPVQNPEGINVMPPILTIGGPCTYTAEDKKDFELMMRTKAQSRDLGLPPNGSFDWPDARSFCLCPCCGASASPDTGEEYILLFNPLMQASPSGLGLRTICRLTCVDCFEELVDGLTIEATISGSSETFNLSVMEAVEAQGPVTWLERGRGVSDSDGEPWRAWYLYSLWEHTGTWEALQMNFNTFLEETMKAGGFKVAMEDPKSQSKRAEQAELWVMKAKSRTGKKCSMPGCEKVHRSRPEGGGKKVRLSYCTGCQDTLYCSRECQKSHRDAHRQYCKAKQREREEAEEAERKGREKEEKARADAVAESFAPLSLLSPQSGGTGKKKKKAGGKKKKGKK